MTPSARPVRKFKDLFRTGGTSAGSDHQRGGFLSERRVADRTAEAFPVQAVLQKEDHGNEQEEREELFPDFPELHCGKRQHAIRRERHQQHPGFPVDAPQEFRPPEKIPPVQPIAVRGALIRNLPGFRHHCPFRQVYC